MADDYICTMGKIFVLAAAFLCAAVSVRAEARCVDEPTYTAGKVLTDTLSEVVVTGTRNKTDIRHLPMTVSVVDRPVIEYSNVPSLLPVLVSLPHHAALWAMEYLTVLPVQYPSAV